MTDDRYIHMVKQCYYDKKKSIIEINIIYNKQS